MVVVKRKDGPRQIRYILGIDDNTDFETYKFNLKKSGNKTGQFYMSRYTNCSAAAVVAALGFIERFHKGVSKEKMINIFLYRKEIKMSLFLNNHLVGEDGITTQVALFLQGMKYLKSKYRHNISFKNPQ
eukprot:Pgem_evm1s15057